MSSALKMFFKTKVKKNNKAKTKQRNSNLIICTLHKTENLWMIFLTSELYIECLKFTLILFIDYFKETLFWKTNICYPRSSHQRCSVRKGVLRNFTKSQENTCARASDLQLYYKRVQVLRVKVQVFSCELCEISKNTFPYRTTLVAASFIPWYARLRRKC